jgi:hypothetical protein
VVGARAHVAEGQDKHHHSLSVAAGPRVPKGSAHAADALPHSLDLPPHSLCLSPSLSHSLSLSLCLCLFIPPFIAAPKGSAHAVSRTTASGYLCTVQRVPHPGPVRLSCSVLVLRVSVSVSVSVSVESGPLPPSLSSRTESSRMGTSAGTSNDTELEKLKKRLQFVMVALIAAAEGCVDRLR